MSDQTLDPGTPEASSTTNTDSTPEVTNQSTQEAPAAEVAAQTPEPAPAPEPAAEVAAEPAAEVAPEPAAEVAAEPAAEVAAEPAAEAAQASDPTKAVVGEKIDLDAVQSAAMSITPEEFAQRQEEERVRREEERVRKAAEKEARDAAFAELEELKKSGASFEITVDERVKGGLRGSYKDLRIFLPASHFGVRKNVPEEELLAAVGQTFGVKVHELQSDEAGFKSAVVTRRDLLLEDFWGGIEVGGVYEGVVTSVTTFGAFVNIGGVEGLVHVSRLSRARIEKPSDVVKKGDKLKVTVADIDRDKKKLSLSHREHEDDPWTGVDTKFPDGTRTKGTVKRITDFGAYVQVAPKIEGLLRISELSWTQRIKHPSDVITVGQEIEVEILNNNAAKHQLALGYKQTLDNPWLTVGETLPIGSEISGAVQQVSTQGAVIRVNGTFDGFMPRSKMLNSGRGQKIELAEGQEVECLVVDLDAGAASLILAMKNEDGTAVSGGDDDRGQRGGRGGDDRGPRGGGRGGDDRGPRGGGRGGDDRGPRGGGRGGDDRGHRGGRDQSAAQHQTPAAGVTIGDLLKEADKSKLNN